MGKPPLKQFGELAAKDFARHPVWVSCHTVDTEEAWYDETDEETFRPWTGALPVDPDQGMFLVRAEVILADGSRHDGFLTPAHQPGDLGTLQPQIFVDGGVFGFWGGMFGIPPEGRQALYKALGRTAADVFPARVTAVPGLSRAVCAAEVQGFYRSPDLKQVEIER